MQQYVVNVMFFLFLCQSSDDYDRKTKVKKPNKQIKRKRNESLLEI